MLPIKGKYLVSSNVVPNSKTLVYPVPMNSVTLGIHSTITTDGFMKIGPSAAPAFSSENY